MSAVWIAWTGLGAAAAVGLALLVRTRWLQSHTLTKCVLLSVLLHAALAAVCACVGGLMPASWGRNDEGRMSMTVALAEEPADEQALAEAAAPADEQAAEDSPEDVRLTQDPSAPDPSIPDLLAISDVEPPAAEAPPAPADLVPLLDAIAETTEEPPREAAGDAGGAAAGAAAAAIAASGTAASHRVPESYADRAGDRRAVAAAARGGSQETERAVQAALAWLSAAQSSDGRWNAARHGGGVERAVQGHHRQGAGARSDHGVTGLALLAFLGAGNTHREGVYAEIVARGIGFLVARQRPDGSLAGDAEFFAALYCHGMSTIALAECCAMTGDAALKPPLERAVRHTLAMQNLATGGWRYAAGDRGDTSQLGWQVMVLSSARNAGLGGLEPAEARARMFLQSVSSGAAGGIAAYRPGERPSLTMTAEALVCRLFLGMPADHPAAAEALDMLARSPPDRSSPNAYTWYYGTLAAFHAGGPQWDRWNASLQTALLPLQRRESGPLDGSWDPDPVWGGHGGRVYSTALSAMTLEVYYRHLPMHRQAARMAAAPR
jgi:hypothetical protein